MPQELLDPTSQTMPPIVSEDEIRQQVVTPEQVAEVALQFSPRTELDNTGLTRTIFEFNGQSFSFKGREETPIYHSLETSRPVYLGRESVWLANSPKPDVLTKAGEDYLKSTGASANEIADINQSRTDEWQKEHDRLAGFTAQLEKLHESNTDAPEHLLVEQSAYGVFALLEKLQPDNPHWKEEKEKVGASQYDDEALGLIDMITAVDSVGLDPSMESQDRQEQPPYGEVVAIAAIMGDEQAKLLVEKATQEQSQREEAITQPIEQRETYDDQEAFKPEDLVIVHATRYKPQLGDNGYEVQTLHDAIGFPRATIHTSINHKVESHMFGEWDDSNYVIIAGFDKMLQFDGAPISINGADTYWTRNPGEKLAFPEGTLIAPGGNQSELFARTPQNEVTYKTEGFTPTDLDIITESLGASTRTAIEEGLKSANLTLEEIDSPVGRKIVANVMRDALVRREITQTRQKQLLEQMDDKFMPLSTQSRIDKMAADLGLAISSGLHAGASEEIAERKSGSGERILGFRFTDPKVRRVVYASGLMNAGGTAKQVYDRQQKFLDNNLW
jgi:hypothetical protein